MSDKNDTFSPLSPYQLDQLSIIKNWLGTGSINFFGLLYSGKDTIGGKLAEHLGAKFFSSGDILRSSMSLLTPEAAKITNSGGITPTDEFSALVPPYFAQPEIANIPLILSMVGRLPDEVNFIREVAASSGHHIKAVVNLFITEQMVITRWEAAKNSTHRAGRADDRTLETVLHRIEEFKQNVLPSIDIYRKLGLLIEINAEPDRSTVLASTIESLCHFALNH